MSTTQQQEKKPLVDGTRLGECAAVQPLSGIESVHETFAVSSSGRGGYARMEETKKPAGQA